MNSCVLVLQRFHAATDIFRDFGNYINLPQSLEFGTYMWGEKKNPLSLLTSLGETKLPLPTSQLKLQKDLICKGV